LPSRSNALSRRIFQPGRGGRERVAVIEAGWFLAEGRWRIWYWNSSQAPVIGVLLPRGSRETVPPARRAICPSVSRRRRTASQTESRVTRPTVTASITISTGCDMAYLQGMAEL